jgi:rhodanese-related sulfurtransferase
MDKIQKRRFKNQLYDEFARLGKALASGRRLELLDLLAQGERTVEELAREADLSVANASQHLQGLRRARLVETRQEGTYVFYRLADDAVFGLWQALREMGERRLGEIDRITRDYLEKRDRLEPIRMLELLGRLQAGEVVLLDVRPEKEYVAGHIAGARSVPLDELEARLSGLSLETEIVAYCRGPYCVFADEAAEQLGQRGFSVRRLDAGFPDWKAAGLPVEYGSPEAAS